MEALVFGLIALSTLHKKREQIVPEPAEFWSFDLRILEQVFNAGDNSASTQSDRMRSYVPTRGNKDTSARRRVFPPAVPFNYPNN